MAAVLYQPGSLLVGGHRKTIRRNSNNNNNVVTVVNVMVLYAHYADARDRVTCSFTSQSRPCV